MSVYLGDFAEDADLFHKFTTRAFATGVPTTLAGTPVLSVYKDEGGAATEKTTAEAYFDLDVDHDSIAGWNNVRIDLSGDAFFVTGADYAVVITTGTVDGVNVFGETLFTFSIENRSMGQPAGATLAADVAALKAETTLIKAVTDVLQQVAASGAVESSVSNSSTQVQTDLAEATDGHYDVMTILFTSGAEAGQSRLITGYTGSTGVVSWNAALTGTPADDVTFVIVAAGTTADAVWDEILTGSSHNIATSAGKRLRQLEQAFVQAQGTIATVTNGHTITLDSGAVATADYYPHSRLTIVEGTGAGQSRLIINYTSGRVCTLESDFTTSPDTASLYTIEAADANVASDSSDLAQGFVATFTNTTTITLDSGAIATTDFHKDTIISFTSGAGAGQEREITAYTSGRVCTLSPALTTALDTTTTYRIVPSVSAAHIADEVWDEAQADHTAAGSFGEIAVEIALILADTNELQGDDLPGLIAALNDLSTAQVNAEMVDVLTVDAIAELAQGIPVTTPTVVTALMLLYMSLRNRHDVDETNNFREIYNDAGVVITKKATSDDGSVYTEGKMETGP